VTDPSPPGGTRWSRVTDIFGRAVELPPEAREAFVRDAAGADEDLGAEVLSLLDAHDRAGSFIQDPAPASPPDTAGAFRNAPLAPGEVLGQYRVAGMIGEGGMGVVYLAEDRRLGRAVALKALTPAWAEDPGRTSRLRREARAAAALNHPGIATVYALEEIDGRLFIASEYVPGETLRDELLRGAMAVPRARETISAIARALGAAHARGIVHRDLKPENVIRTPDGQIKILDFGLAHFQEPDVTQTNLTGDRAIGTPAYMSPEQIRGAPVDARADIFSLGVLAYELLTSRHPFAASTPAATLARIIQDEPAPLAARAGSASSDPMLRPLDDVVRRCLRKAPEDRYQTAIEVADAVEQAAGIRPSGTPVTVAELPSGPAGRGAMWWWQFHQAAATAVYVLLLLPLWRARSLSPGSPGNWLFLAAVIAVVVAGTTRLHLWFAARLDDATWRAQQHRARRWTVGADAVFALALLAGGLLATGADDGIAVLLVAASAAVLVSSVIVEPATTRAAADAASRRSP
jgi:predicted Ser/Thr protein kinase